MRIWAVIYVTCASLRAVGRSEVGGDTGVGAQVEERNMYVHTYTHWPTRYSIRSLVTAGLIDGLWKWLLTPRLSASQPLQSAWHSGEMSGLCGVVLSGLVIELLLSEQWQWGQKLLHRLRGGLGRRDACSSVP